MEDRDGIDWTTTDKPAESVGRTPGAEPSSKRRVMTEARREQNRLAQRAYRKRQKEHRKQLKEAESRRYQTRRPRPLLKRCDSASKPISWFQLDIDQTDPGSDNTRQTNKKAR
ncbi:hypothetical protein CDV31_011692 [Fusarium ambrosium]|uniref:BZIP domain-containing protein n=1 Tax=Fusarium ambrosium TaxID=131363 RepID=A0A428TF39_9HYPO|nr:hypothetical protein CDV31_011692 [Fusarium ambrosium]